MKLYFIQRFSNENFHKCLCKYGNYYELSYYDNKLEEIDWYYLSCNPNAIHILEKNFDKICWLTLNENPNAIHILEKNLDKIHYNTIFSNPNLYKIIDKLNKKYIEQFKISKEYTWFLSSNLYLMNILENGINEKYINWYSLSSNCDLKAISILENNIDKIIWSNLSSNPNAISIIEKNLNKVDKWSLNLNPNAINILKNNLNYIDWDFLSFNPNAIDLIEKNMDKINWKGLTKNSNAIHLLINNLDKIDSYFLCFNSNSPKILLKLDYKKIKEENKHLTEEIVKYVFNPNRLLRLCYIYDLSFDEINEFY